MFTHNSGGRTRSLTLNCLRFGASPADAAGCWLSDVYLLSGRLKRAARAFLSRQPRTPGGAQQGEGRGPRRFTAFLPPHLPAPWITWETNSRWPKPT